MRSWVWLLLGAAAVARAQAPLPELLESKTIDALRRFDAGFDGVLGVAAIDLQTGRLLEYHADGAFATASVIKVPILVRMYQAERDGQFRFPDRITLQPAEAVGGSGHLQERLKSGPVTLTIRDLLAAMIEDSDNTATNKCIELAGMERVNGMLDALGFRQTRLRRRMMDGAAARRGEENVSTPREMARLMELIYRGKAVDEAASREMLDLLKKVEGGIRQGLPLDVETASKTGELPGARCETGIVFLPGRPFVLSVMSGFIDDRRTPVPEVTRIVYGYFEKLAGSNAYGNRLP